MISFHKYLSRVVGEASVRAGTEMVIKGYSVEVLREVIKERDPGDRYGVPLLQICVTLLGEVPPQTEFGKLTVVSFSKELADTPTYDWPKTEIRFGPILADELDLT